MRVTRGIACAILLLPSLARAAEAPSVDDVDALTGQFDSNLHTRAHEVSFDTRQKRLELSGDVQVDAAPFHLRSDRIVLTRTRLGIEIEGEGKLAFCPCLGTPLTVDFTAALVAPPGDIVLTDPKVRVYGVPVFYLPYFWLRSDEKIGVLPPDLAYRGTDGFFVGEGVHLPFRTGAGKNAIDLRGGAYLVDGFASDLRLRTPVSLTRLHYDRLRTDDGFRGRRARCVARGVVGRRRHSRCTWRVVDDRARCGGPSVGSRRDRRHVAERRVHGGDARSIRLAARRRHHRLRRRGPRERGSLLGRLPQRELGRHRGRGLAPHPGPVFLVRARAEAGGLAAAHLGGVGVALSLRGIGDLHAERDTHGTDRALSARLHMGVPLARAFGADIVHLVEPFVEVAALDLDGTSYLAGPIVGSGGVAEAGIHTSLGGWASRNAIEVSLSGGGTLDGGDVHGPLARGRIAASAYFVGIGFDGGYANDGIALAAHGRLGPRESLHLLGHVATREGPDPVLARVLTDAPLDPTAGFLASEGTTTGGALELPLGRVTTSGGADVDATRGELVAVYGGLQLHDRCNCVTLRANAAHRIGRSGVDGVARPRLHTQSLNAVFIITDIRCRRSMAVGISQP